MARLIKAVARCGLRSGARPGIKEAAGGARAERRALWRAGKRSEDRKSGCGEGERKREEGREKERGGIYQVGLAVSAWPRNASTREWPLARTTPDRTPLHTYPAYIVRARELSPLH